MKKQLHHPSAQPAQALAGILNVAIAHHQAGRLPEARQLYQQVLSTQPRQPDALHLLGLIAHQSGQHTEAAQLIAQAIAIAPTAPMHCNMGAVLQALDRLQEAETHLQQAIALQPEYADAYNSLGNTHLKQNQVSEAIQCYQQALALRPGDALTLNNMATAFDRAHRSTEAAAFYRQAIQANPGYLEAMVNLGSLLHDQGDYAAAEQSFLEALAICPGYPDALYNLGNTQAKLNKFTEAEACYRQVIAAHPYRADCVSNLAAVLLKHSKPLEAIALYQQVLQLAPDSADAHYNLAVAYQQIKQPDQAILTYRKALQCDPNHFQALGNLGVVLKEQHQFDEALECQRKALSLNPNSAESLNNYGVVLMGQQNYAEAISYFQQALAIDPQFKLARTNLEGALVSGHRFTEAKALLTETLSADPDNARALNLLGGSYALQGDHLKGIQLCHQAMQLEPDNSNMHTDAIFFGDMHSGFSVASLQQERARWAALHAKKFYSSLPHPNNPDPDRKLRVGYVSADFRRHSAPTVFMSMLVHFEPLQFEIYAYSNSSLRDQDTKLIEQHVNHWRNIVNLSDDDVAAQIRQDEIDILVDLSGHSGGNRLLVFARKPAPIQITAWGYIGGTGMKAMDVFFADDIVVPLEERHLYAEKVVYLPSVVSYYPFESFPATSALPALAGRGFTFGSFNRLTKITEASFQLWAQVLLAVPNSRMILKTIELDQQGERERVHQTFADLGVPPERIVLQGKTSWMTHIAAFNQVDIALDPFPHGGGVTTLEGLMMGVPVVVLRWPTVPGRLSAAMLTPVGLTDWIAETPEQYVSIAVEKASNLMALAILRKQLRNKMTHSIIGNPQAYAKEVEKVYRQLWQAWCTSQ